MEITRKIAKRITLRDDATETGGISYIGETLDNFMAEAGVPFGSSLKRVNEALVECGIEPLCKEEFMDAANPFVQEDVKQYLDCDVYQVEVDKSTGKKVIHIDGFCYFNDEEYQLVKGTFCYMDIDGTQCTEKAQEIFENTKQYQGTVSLEEVEEYYKQCTPLPYDEVTQDTPCGFYVN